MLDTLCPFHELKSKDTISVHLRICYSDWVVTGHTLISKDNVLEKIPKDNE